MRGSVSVLKVSILAALLIAVASALSTSLPLAATAIVLVISPVLYYLSRDLIFPNIPRETHRLGLVTRILEIAIEAAMNAMIGLAVVFLLTGHF